MAEASRTRLGKQDRTAGNSSRGTQSRDIHHWARGWELQKWPLWTPNDSCGGCALWQSLPGHALVNRIARRGTPPAGRKAVTFIIGRGDGNSKSGLYGRPMIHVGAAPYGRAFPRPLLCEQARTAGPGRLCRTALLDYILFLSAISAILASFRRVSPLTRE